MTGLQEFIFHGQAPGMWLLKMDMPWMKCKQSTSFYARRCINEQERADVHSLTLYKQSIDSKTISLSPISKIT